MLKTLKTAQERWGGVDKLIDNWLNARQELIVQFCGLSASKPLSRETPIGPTLSRFCETLMDYCSAAHFEVYDQVLAEVNQHLPDGKEKDRTLDPRLDELTSLFVDFNDTYDRDCTLDMLAQLPDELCKMGELLEERFELEDQLIERLYSARQQQAVVV